MKAFRADAALNVYSMWGMVLIEGVNFVPLTFLLMSAVLKSTDAAFEEASMMTGVRSDRHLPAHHPPHGHARRAGAAAAVFIRAFESFEVPAMVGLAGNIKVLTTNIYQSSRARPPNYGECRRLFDVPVRHGRHPAFFYNRLSRHAHKYQTITGKGYRPRVIDLGKWRYGGTALLVAILASLSACLSWPRLCLAPALLRRLRRGKS